MAEEKKSVEEEGKHDDHPAQENIDAGKKVIEMEKKTSGKSDDEAEKDQQKDAEKWRNEG